MFTCLDKLRFSKYFFSTLIAILAIAPNLSGQRLLFEGFVKDENTKRALVGANLQLKKLPGALAVTDTVGYFRWLVPAGSDEVLISFVGYESKSIKLLFDTLKGSVNIYLNELNTQLDEIEVSSQRGNHNVESLDIGVNRLGISLIKKLPAFMGEVDVIKSLLSMPGVTNVGEGTSDINVRGGNSDQNLILLEEAPIFNPSHLMGLFSVFNPDMVRNLSFYRGSIPAQYGGRTSAVLDMSVKSPDNEKFNVQGGVGLIANRVLVEGPIVKNKLSFAIGGRASFSDYLFKISNNSLIKDTQANFYDITSRVEYIPNKKNRLYLTVYSSNDLFKPNGNNVTSSGASGINGVLSEFSWNIQNLTLSWVRSFSDRLSLKVVAVNSINRATISNIDDFNGYKLRSSIAFQSVHPQLTWQVGKSQFLFGVEANLNNLQPGTLIPSGSQSSINSITLDYQKASTLAGYFSDEFQLGKFLFNIGTRYSYFTTYGGPTRSYTYLPGMPFNEMTVQDTVKSGLNDLLSSYGGFEPRFSVNVRLGSTSSIKFGYNRMIQYIQRISNTTAAVPTDRWQVSNQFIKPQIADQLSLGFFKNFRDNEFESHVEVFGKQLANITDYKDGANVLLQNSIEQSVLQGKGEVYGFETQIKKNRGNFSGWLNYTYSETRYLINGFSREEQVNNGEWYSPNFNKPHIINLVIVYKINRRVSYSANFTYSSGRPITYPANRYFIGTTLVPNFIDRNQDRIPDYHRLDLSLTVEPNPEKKRKFRGTWIFSIYNVYGRKNAYSVFSNTVYPGGQSFFVNSNTYQLSIFGSIFPSVTYNFNFN